jgi:hypothetical protein
MTEPKVTIYNKIHELVTTYPTLSVYQARPEVIESFPTITFYISNNVPEYDLDKQIGRQDIMVAIDIWANTDAESSELLIALEAKMKEINYLLSFNSDILDPDGYSHLTTQFTF